MSDDPLEAFRQMFNQQLPPAPKFDRVVVHDERALHDFQRHPAPTKLLPALTGFPVVIDPEVEVGVIELRKGDEVYRRFHLPELRA